MQWGIGHLTPQKNARLRTPSGWGNAAWSMDAVERVVASLEAQVVGAEATLGAVGNAEEKAKPRVAKNARTVTRGASAHGTTLITLVWTS